MVDRMVTDYVIILITILIWRPLMVAIASNHHQVKFLPEPEAWVSEVYDYHSTIYKYILHAYVVMINPFCC